ncbi:MAG: hypothetical protein JW839_11665 [Candidatus Lokiarchaeota archaeon]|nr:hypothetical protein [Candidatus Lokiarchaeota archaeon]
MELEVRPGTSGEVLATALHGMVVVPNQAGHVWDLDAMSWYAIARPMGTDTTCITIKAGPHSTVQIEVYVEMEGRDPGSLPGATAMLVFSSDIPEFDGDKAFTSYKAQSGTLVVESIGTRRWPGRNAGTFDLSFPGRPSIRGTYLAPVFAEPWAV